jgi:hypothetical protein
MTKFFLFWTISFSIFAYEARFTAKDQLNGDLASILTKIAETTTDDLTVEDLFETEKLNFATSDFFMYSQMIDGVPVLGSNIRIWTQPNTTTLIQAEIKIDDNSLKYAGFLSQKKNKAKLTSSALKSGKLLNHTLKEVRDLVAASDDSSFRNFESQDYWIGQDLVRRFKVTARRGVHIIDFSLFKNKIVSNTYKEFPRHDGEINLKAHVYPIYEEVEATGERLPRMESELKYIHPTTSVAGADPFAELKARRYQDQMYDPLLALTADGWENGYWSSSVVKNKAKAISEALPTVNNDFASGLRLEGRYVTINIHPDAKTAYSGIDFELSNSAHFMPQWKQINGAWEMIPNQGLLGKPVFSEGELLTRPAERYTDHAPVKYINDGFDEIQVYWAVTTFMESLQSLGFSDPELSTRQFHAFLFDPDIEMRDNAYYTNDTINFTTYSPKAANYARDNSTIWHELGHGIMDRLMGEGDLLQLTDTGGLSEGMADFLAQLVVAHVMKGSQFSGANDFRIINVTGFNLTNEVHDDGEAYGGAMYDMLQAAQSQFGFDEGLKKISDLVFETMRFCRSHQALDANEWFEHMLFADELGSSHRGSNELKNIILEALAGRNFSLVDNVVAQMEVKYNNTTILDSRVLGSRNNPIRLTMKKDETKNYQIQVKLTETEGYKFVYPVTIKIEYKKSALQGAIKWMNEEEVQAPIILSSAQNTAEFSLGAHGECESINQPDGTCKDYALIQIFNANNVLKPVAKKRFYLKIKTQE